MEWDETKQNTNVRDYPWRSNELTQLAVAAKRDEAVLCVIVERFQGLLRSVARRYRDVAGYDEAYQEACLALLNAVRGYQIERGPFPAYAAAKVRGDVRTAMRRLWTAADRWAFVGPSTHSDDADEGLDEALEKAWWQTACTMEAETGRWLRKSVIETLIRDAGLSQRELLWLRCMLAGATQETVANMAGVSGETVKTWRRRAIAKLRLTCAAAGVTLTDLL